MGNKSTHRAEVVEVRLRPHENSDNLSIVDIYGFQVVARTEDWQERTKGIYIQPDSLVDTSRPEFSFLKREGRDIERIKVKRLRGILSMGLLIPCPDDAQIGEDYAEQLGITRYEPDIDVVMDGECRNGPSGIYPKYNIDAFLRYNHYFIENELIYISEKLDGSNARFVYKDGEIYVGSRTLWKKYNKDNMWWIAFEKTPSIEEFCKNNEGLTLYGEVYGNNGKMPYAEKRGNIRFAAFDIMLPNCSFINILEAKELAKNVPWVPEISRDFKYNFQSIKKFAEGNTLIDGANHIREGVVIKPLIERNDVKTGRISFKIINPVYYNIGDV